ncbi:wax ester/triacylglycerol synthase domain-containing protein [[Actinomadura] parvosata]|uniref:wax ester/triacylglycerol synthase domain-containing protein n=1 Tax=[Actinomadura] parvosata TaxID=1955412 RepID=UPI00406D013A
MPGAPPPPETLCGLVADRARQAAPTLRYRLTGTGRRARWSLDPSFDPARHIEYHRLEPGSSVHQVAADLVTARPLPRDRPLWTLMVLHGHAPDEHVLLYRVHHAFQDALGLLSTAWALLGGQAPPPPAPVRAPGCARVPAPRLERSATSAIREALPGLRRLVTAAPPPWHPAQVPGDGGPRLFVVPLDARVLRDVAGRTGTTVAQVSLALVAGALRAWRAELETPAAEGGTDLTVGLPVGLLGRRDHPAVGNHVGLLPVTLPCSEPSPRERLRRVAAQMTLPKIARQRRTARGLYALPTALTRPVLRAVLPMALRGPADRLDVGAIHATRVFPGARAVFLCPPLAPRAAAMLTVLHDRDTASVSGIFDTHVARPEQVLDAVRQALGELHADVLTSEATA